MYQLTLITLKPNFKFILLASKILESNGEVIELMKRGGRDSTKHFFLFFLFSSCKSFLQIIAPQIHYRS